MTDEKKKLPQDEIVTLTEEDFAYIKDSIVDLKKRVRELERRVLD